MTKQVSLVNAFYFGYATLCSVRSDAGAIHAFASEWCRVNALLLAARRKSLAGSTTNSLRVS